MNINASTCFVSFTTTLILWGTGLGQTGYWVPASGIPSSWTIYSIAGTSSNVLVAGTDGGVFLSYDGGASWAANRNYMSTLGVFAIFYDPNFGLFAGSQGWGYHSTDGGITWSPIYGPWGYSPPRLSSLLSDSTSHILMGTYHGIYGSGDGGNNWSESDNGLTSPRVTSLCRGMNGAIFASTSDAGIFRSMDGGNTWSLTSEPDSSVNRTVSSTNGSVFAWTSKGIQYSTDNGTSWARLPLTGVNSLVKNRNGYVFIGANGDTSLKDVRVYRSTSNGVSWDTLLVANALDPVLIPSDLRDTVFAQAGDGSLYRSTDNGTTWEQTSNYLPVEGVTALCMKSDGTLFVGGYAGCYRSTDLGGTWTDASPRYSPAGGHVMVSALIFAGGVLYAGRYGGVVYKSTDNGQSWTGQNLGHDIESFAADSSGFLFAGTAAGGVYRESDSGTGWIPVSTGLTNISQTSVYGLYASSDGSVFAGSDSGLFVSSDQGEHWNRVNGVGKPVTCIITDPSRNLILAGTYLRGIYRSTDWGHTWQQSDSGLGNLDIRGIIRTPRGVYVVATSSGAYYSADNGKSWINASSGIYNTVLTSLVINQSGQAFAGTSGSGVMRSTPNLSRLTSDSSFPPTMPPLTFNLSQNYPNPFNPSTVINYHLPVNSHVVLKVYDVLGRLVKTLVDQSEDAGSHYVIFNADGLASGVYFYRLDAASFSMTEKMVLIR